MRLLRLLSIIRKWTRVVSGPRPRRTTPEPARPIGIARGGAPLIIGVGLCLALAGLSGQACAAGQERDLVRGEVLAVQGDGARLTLHLPSGEILLVPLATAALVTLNGRTVNAQALRPVTGGSFVEATARLNPAGEADAIEGRYHFLEGIVVDLREPEGLIRVRTLDADGRGELRELSLAGDLTVVAGGFPAGLTRVQSGAPVLVLLNWAGEVKKIELPPA